MGWPEFGDERDVTPRLDSERADDLKQRMKEEGRWPPKVVNLGFILDGVPTNATLGETHLVKKTREELEAIKSKGSE